jgi:hypothetical protein
MGGIYNRAFPNIVGRITPLLILVHFFCKAAETRKNTSKVNKSRCCPEIHKLQVKTNNSIFVVTLLDLSRRNGGNL